MNREAELKRLRAETRRFVIKNFFRWTRNPEFLAELQRINQEMAEKCGMVIDAIPFAVSTKIITVEESIKKSASIGSELNPDPTGIVGDDIVFLKKTGIKVTNGEVEELREDLHKALAGILNGGEKAVDEIVGANLTTGEGTLLGRYHRMASEEVRSNEEILASIMRLAINIPIKARYFVAAFLKNHEAMRSLGVNFPASKSVIENDGNWLTAVGDTIGKLVKEADMYGMGKTMLVIFESLFKKAVEGPA